MGKVFGNNMVMIDHAFGDSRYNIECEGGRAACINIIPCVHSKFWWKEKIEHCDETLMIIKSRREVFDELAESVRAIHSYQVPEIIAVPVQRGLTEYLAWIDQTTRKLS